MENPHNDIFQQWKNASVYERKRLGLLKQIDGEDWGKLLDRDEQRQFRLESDEFLVYADKYMIAFPKILVVLMNILVFFYIPLFTYLRFHKNTDNAEYILISAFILVCIVFYIILSCRKNIGNLLITNKKIHLDNQHELTKFCFQGLSIKNDIFLCQSDDTEPPFIPYNVKDYDRHIISFSNQYLQKQISLRNMDRERLFYTIGVISYMQTLVGNQGASPEKKHHVLRQ